jgi:hypothetical protein
MRAGIVVNVTRADRRRLEAIVADRSAPQKHVWRANIILATADGCGTAEIMRRSGKAKPVVWTWQARFMAEGVEGLLRDKTRRPGKPPMSTDTVQRVVDLALGPPPREATHWTGRELAKAVGVTAARFGAHHGAALAILNCPAQKKSGPGFLRGPTYTARGVHPTALPSIFISSRGPPLSNFWQQRRKITGARPSVHPRAGRVNDQFFLSKKLERSVPLHVNGISKVAVDCWKHGDDRAALVVVGGIIDLFANCKLRHRKLLLELSKT